MNKMGSGTTTVGVTESSPSPGHPLRRETRTKPEGAAAALAAGAALAYRRCPTCQLDTLHDGEVCRFCEPGEFASEAFCAECDTPFVDLSARGNQRFCTKRCRERAWARTETGRAWLAEKRRRRRATRLERSA